MADSLGLPLAFHLKGGEASNCKAYDALIVLYERTPDALLADKGYDSDAIHADHAKRNIAPVILGRSNRRVQIEHDRTFDKQRNRIERIFSRLALNRAIATRSDQLATASSASSTSPSVLASNPGLWSKRRCLRSRPPQIGARACDLVQPRISDMLAGGVVGSHALIVQQKMGTPVRFDEPQGTRSAS